MAITIRSAHVSDASALSRIGAKTCRDRFEGSNSAADMARYLAEAFTPQQPAAEIADRSSALFPAERRSDDGRAELVSYEHPVSGEVPEAVRGPTPMEIERLYVDLARHGQRVA